MTDNLQSVRQSREYVEAELQRHGIEYKDLKAADRIDPFKISAKSDVELIEMCDKTIHDAEKRIRYLEKIINEPEAQAGQYHWHYSRLFKNMAKKEIGRFEHEIREATRDRTSFLNSIDHQHRQVAGSDAELHDNPRAKKWRRNSVLKPVVKAISRELQEAGMSNNMIQFVIGHILHERCGDLFPKPTPENESEIRRFVRNLIES